MIDESEFMQAVYELGQGTNKGRASGEQIMRRLGLEPSALVDVDKNPTTDDDRLYRDLAYSCHQKGYIRKVANGYEWVDITQSGIEYVEGRL